jgi:hypothetical protein
VEIALQFLTNLLSLSLDASPWLVLGLVIAGLMKAWLPSKILHNHLGTGKSAIVKAALIGAPLPLCSCGVIPVATELKRSGASASATSSFLVATPETGVDSVSVSYALLGPILAIYRPITAICSAIITGMIVQTIRRSKPQVAGCSRNISVQQTQQSNAKPQQNTVQTCCAKTTASNATIEQQSRVTKTLVGLRYAATKLIDDLIIWLLIGLIFASVIQTFIETSFLSQHGSGISAMLLMIAISIPMYICATASTPIAAGFIMAGISPGTALVFMMAGPATNISTLGVIKKEMGQAVLIRYLLSIVGCSIGFGLLLDWLVAYFTLDISSQMQHSHAIVPLSISVTSTVILTLLAIKPLRNQLFKPEQ